MDEIIYLSVGWLLIWHMYYMHLISFSIFFSGQHNLVFITNFLFLNLSSKMWCSSCIAFLFFIGAIFYLFGCFFSFSLCVRHTLSLPFISGHLRFSRFPIRFTSYCLQQYYFGWCFIYFVCRLQFSYVLFYSGSWFGFYIFFSLPIFLCHDHGTLDGPL